MAQAINIGEQLKLIVEGRDAGQAVRLPGRPTWAVDVAHVALAVAADSLSCVVTGQSAGDCTVTARAAEFAATYAISVLPKAATSIVIIAEVM